MGYKNTTVKFISNKDVKSKADSFRIKFWGDKIPVGIEEIIEIKLKIKIIPIPNLMNQCGVDAQITSDFSAVYVDQASYENDTSRFRFSLAHELGHLILHKNFYSNLKIKNLDDVYGFMKEINSEEYSYLETQANKFANYFLIPRNELIKVRNEIVGKVEKKHDISNIDEKTLNSYLAGQICPFFAVSSGSAEIALNDLNNLK